MHWFIRLWKKLPEGFRWNLEDTFQPEDIAERLLPGEEPELEIRPAWYRDIFGHVLLHYLWLVILVTLLFIFGVFAFAYWGQAVRLSTSLLYGMLPLILLIVFVIYGIKEKIEYNQWRILKTNARLIISIPQPGAFPLVDNIELQGLPKVLDTNWSPKPIWRLFQFFTGARDLYLSLAAYKFIEGTARVGDALIIPDVMPKDVFELKQLVFKVPKK
ncbi:MAG: hypothetical protein AAF614_03210 [Chloroflexota bacterium]